MHFLGRFRWIPKKLNIPQLALVFTSSTHFSTGANGSQLWICFVFMGFYKK